MELIFSKVAIGVITLVLGTFGLFLESKKEGKITRWGKAVFLLLVLLGFFSIFSELIEWLNESREKNQRQSEEIIQSEKKEKEYIFIMRFV